LGLNLAAILIGLQSAYVVEKLVWKSPILGRFDLLVGSASVIFAILAF
jgi:hypothetical protein